MLLKVKAQHIRTQIPILETAFYGGILTNVSAYQAPENLLNIAWTTLKAQQRDETKDFHWIKKKKKAYDKLLGFVRKP